MKNIVQDLTFALRQLRRSPGFALTAILTLALGIGANTAIFSLLDQALLRSLPVRDPSRLVLLKDTGTAWNGSIGMNGGTQEDYFSYPAYEYLRDQAHGFTGLVATSSQQVGLTRNRASQFVSSEVVSGNYFEVLGVAPALGRVLNASDDRHPGADAVAVVSYDYWQGHMGADPGVVNSQVSINGRPYTIVGVAAPKFQSAVWGQTTDLFVPMSMFEQLRPPSVQRAGADQTRTDHTTKWLNILARLQPGTTIEQATVANEALWHALRVDELNRLSKNPSPRLLKGFLHDSHLKVVPGARGFSFNRTDLEKPFLAVMAMAVFVLLIASVNVASLLMVRSAGRVREFSLRAALGASSGRVAMQLLLEGMLIGLFGGIVGLLLAPIAVRVLIGRLAGSDGQTAFSGVIDVRILLFNFVVAVGVSLLFSMVPALQLRKPNLASTLRESTGTHAGGLLQLRRIVVCLQIGLSVILLVGAGLFIRTMQKLRSVEVGFNPSHLVVFSIDPQLAGYQMAAIPPLQQRVLDGLAAMPGVQSVAATSSEEFADNSSYYGVTVSGYQAPPEESYQVEQVVVTPNYLASMQVPLLSGRHLSDGDTLDHPLAADVNETFVKHYCKSNAECVGRRIGIGQGNVKMDIEVVGVVRDYRHRGVREEVQAAMYRPLRQVPDASQIFLYLRTTTEPNEMFAQVRRAMQQIEPNLAIGPIHTEDEQIDDSLKNERMIELLAISFGVLATVLAGVGLYGVLAYSTTQRTREIGIRMALGSTRAAISSLIVTDVLRLAALGLVVALPVAYGLSTLLRSQLFGVSAVDPAIVFSVMGLIAGVALIAAFFPARRAASVNPTEALRTE